MEIKKKINALPLTQDQKYLEHQARREAMKITVTPEMIEEAEHQQSRMIALFREAMIASGVIKEGSLDKLMEAAFKNIRLFAYHDIFAGFKKSPTLTLAEKKERGLNTRKVYWHALIDCFGLEKIKSVDLKDLMDKCYRRSLCASFRETQVNSALKEGVDQVTLNSLNGCMLLDGQVFRLDDLPALPHKDCAQDVCMCSYSPIYPFYSDLDGMFKH